MPHVLAIVMLMLAAPTTLPADDPRAALAEMMAALAAQDAARLKAVFEPAEGEAARYTESVGRMLLAGRRLTDAATARFGPAGDSLGKGPIAAADAADIPHATVTTSGDTAEVLLPGHTLPLRFRNIAGGWKFRVVDFAGSQPRDLTKQTALTDMFAAAMSEAADEIEQDRYATAPDAEAAIRQKLNFVLMKSLKPPATQPAR